MWWVANWYNLQGKTKARLIPEGSAKTRTQTEGVLFSARLPCHVYYSLSDDFAHSQISDMLAKRGLTLSLFQECFCYLEILYSPSTSTSNLYVKVNILMTGWPTLLCEDFRHQKLKAMRKGMICYHQAHPRDSQPGYQQVQWGAWCLPP
jgi:hypothetical protein